MFFGKEKSSWRRSTVHTVDLAADLEQHWFVEYGLSKEEENLLIILTH